MNRTFASLAKLTIMIATLVPVISCKSDAITGTNQVQQNVRPRYDLSESEMDDLPENYSTLVAVTGNLNGNMSPPAGWGIYSGQSTAYFTASTSISGSFLGLARADGSAIKDGGYMSDGTLWCTFIWACSTYAQIQVECSGGGTGASASVQHFGLWRNGTLFAGTTHMHVGCTRSGGPSEGGGGGECTEGYWQEWFWYDDGVITDHWWEFTCGFAM